MTAFSRQREQARRADLQELAELDAAEAALESGSDGDLEDDFLLAATQVRRRCSYISLRCSGAPSSRELCHTRMMSVMPSPLLLAKSPRYQQQHLCRQQSPKTSGDSHCLTNVAPVATQAEDAEGESPAADSHQGVEHGDDDSSSYAETDYSDGELDRAAASGGVSTSGDARGEERSARRAGGPGGPGSIASTYWRPERTDRKNLLTVVDER